MTCFRSCQKCHTPKQIVLSFPHLMWFLTPIVLESRIQSFSLCWVFWIDISSWLVLECSYTNSYCSSRDTWWRDTYCCETEQAVGKKRVGLAFSVTALWLAILNRSWKRHFPQHTNMLWDEKIQPWSLNGLEEHTYLLLCWDQLSDQSCILYLLQSNCLSWNTWNIIPCFLTDSADVWWRWTGLLCGKFCLYSLEK